MSRLTAPWTPEQVEALNLWQEAGYVHPFMCPGASGHSKGRLIAKTDGWHCPTCSYTQDWAHDFMLTLPPNPLQELAVISILDALIQRLESHEGWELREGVCCHLDVRDRNAIDRGKELLKQLRP